MTCKSSMHVAVRLFRSVGPVKQQRSKVGSGDDRRVHRGPWRAHHGTAGDSVLAGFASVISAVNRAVKIQTRLAIENERPPSARWLLLHLACRRPASFRDRRFGARRFLCRPFFRLVYEALASKARSAPPPLTGSRRPTSRRRCRAALRAPKWGSARWSRAAPRPGHCPPLAPSQRSSARPRGPARATLY